MPLKRGSTRGVISSNDRAYAAGLFDGEGSILASPYVEVTVSMCDYEPVAWFAAKFGGRVRIEKRTTKTGKAIFTWDRYCANAAQFLTIVLPHLKAKRSQAINAIALARLSKPKGKAKLITVNELEQRRLLRTKIHEAKHAIAPISRR